MLSGVTVRELHQAGLSYRDIRPTQGYRVDDSGEIVVITLRTGRIAAMTGKLVARVG